MCLYPVDTSSSYVMSLNHVMSRHLVESSSYVIFLSYLMSCHLVKTSSYVMSLSYIMSLCHVIELDHITRGNCNRTRAASREGEKERSVFSREERTMECGRKQKQGAEQSEAKSKDRYLGFEWHDTAAAPIPRDLA